jgi:hypothetical protein
MITVKDYNLLRFSLVFVWLATALVSVIELRGQSMSLLASSGMSHSGAAYLLILTGAGVDALMGLALWFMPMRRTYIAALAIMVVMTVFVTWLDPALWLNPLGPLTKNLPIAAALWVLARSKA